jgi:hypothetical protein
MGFITLALNSCKMHEDCPAYGNVTVETENNG